ncbi:MAG: tripartite tricarboxylate transporter TctB family protein [Lachnospiraceae bacterium]|nr:tripartite tricarboxylate transporter TctB family protein [Lachnospiraceae bacterium]
MKNAKNDLYPAIGFFLFGIFIFVGSFQIPATTSDILGSRFFPRAVALLIGLLSLIQIAGAMQAAQVAKKAEKEEKKKEKEGKDERKDGLNKPLLLTIAALFGYYVLVLYIGFTITSILYLLAQSAILMSKEDFKSKKTMTVMVLASMIAPIFINTIFWKVFSIALPAGRLF